MAACIPRRCWQRGFHSTWYRKDVLHGGCSDVQWETGRSSSRRNAGCGSPAPLLLYSHQNISTVTKSDLFANHLDLDSIIPSNLYIICKSKVWHPYWSKWIISSAYTKLRQIFEGKSGPGYVKFNSSRHCTGLHSKDLFIVQNNWKTWLRQDTLQFFIITLHYMIKHHCI